jgi:hypothetical protein
MRTPTGRECKFFYGDYYRGRNFEECRAFTKGPKIPPWNSDLCKDCPVPGILLNNACTHLALTVVPVKQLFKTKMKVFAYCSRVHDYVRDPNIGCGQCHET